jgi:hypothetical protein
MSKKIAFYVNFAVKQSVLNYIAESMIETLLDEIDDFYDEDFLKFANIDLDELATSIANFEPFQTAFKKEIEDLGTWAVDDPHWIWGHKILKHPEWKKIVSHIKFMDKIYQDIEKSENSKNEKQKAVDSAIDLLQKSGYTVLKQPNF